MRRVAGTLAVLLLAAALAGCLGAGGSGDGSQPARAETSEAGDGNATAETGSDQGNATSGDDGDGNTTASGGDGNATQEGNATAANATGPQPGDVITQEHITAGSPTTYIRSVTVLTGREGVDSFRWEADLPAGTVLATNTTANQGGPYNLNIYFHDANGTYLGGCGTPQNGEETCEVPEGATQGTVDAAWGADLDVTLYVKAPP